MNEKLQIVEGCQRDYYKLSRYHYQPKLSFPATKIFKAVGKFPYEKHFPDPTAVIVFTQPFPDIASRHKATANFFQKPKETADRLRLVNTYILYLARLITDPRYLRKGIATLLLNESLQQLDTPIIETLTPIDFTNQMYTKAGFELYYQRASLKYSRLIRAFSHINLNVYDTVSPMLIDMRLDYLPPHQRNFIEREISIFLNGFRNAERFKPGPERTKFILSKVPPPEAYLIWFNPASAQAKEILQHRAEQENHSTGLRPPSASVGLD